MKQEERYKHAENIIEYIKKADPGDFFHRFNICMTVLTAIIAEMDEKYDDIIPGIEKDLLIIVKSTRLAIKKARETE